MNYTVYHASAWAACRLMNSLDRFHIAQKTSAKARTHFLAPDMRKNRMDFSDKFCFIVPLTRYPVNHMTVQVMGFEYVRTSRTFSVATHNRFEPGIDSGSQLLSVKTRSENQGSVKVMLHPGLILFPSYSTEKWKRRAVSLNLGTQISTLAIIHLGQIGPLTLVKRLMIINYRYFVNNIALLVLDWRA